MGIVYWFGYLLILNLTLAIGSYTLFTNTGGYGISISGIWTGSILYAKISTPSYYLLTTTTYLKYSIIG